MNFSASRVVNHRPLSGLQPGDRLPVRARAVLTALEQARTAVSRRRSVSVRPSTPNVYAFVTLLGLNALGPTQTAIEWVASGEADDSATLPLPHTPSWQSA